MREIKFGTDGWWAVIAEDFTFGNVRIVAQAIADYVNSEAKGGKKVVIGYDYRFLSDKFAETVSEVLAGNGIKVILADKPTPTPAVSLAIKQKKLFGGVVITASHNPPQYNGIKYKAGFGGSAGPEIINKIESFIGKNEIKSLSSEEATKSASVIKEDLCQAYLKLAKSYLDMKLLKNKKLKVLVDSMYGVDNEYIAELLKDTKCTVKTIHNKRDPNFGGINPEPIEKNLQEFIKETKKGKFDIGLATDGDGDRIGAASPDGKLISSHKILALLLLHLVEDRKWRGSVVRTLSGSTLIDRICKKYNLKLHITPVGFKYICDIMLIENVLIGGEESGGIGFKNYLPERDGVLSGLLLLEMMAYKNKGILRILKDMEGEFGKFRYYREDMHYGDDKKARLVDKFKQDPPKSLLDMPIKKIDSYDGFKLTAKDDSWLLLRFSGTEPILRVYAEAGSDEKARDLVALGKKIALGV